MINVRHTTLVPSYRALIALKVKGELDALATEYAAERDAVAAALDVTPDSITVALSPAARDVSAKDLERAATDNGTRRRLTRVHAIHPDVQPTAQHRVLAPAHIGYGRHGAEEILWATGEGAALLEAELARRHLEWRSPLNNQWPIREATTVPIGAAGQHLLEALTATGRCVDVDPNGRPYPSSTTP